MAVDFLAEIIQLVFAKTAFQVSAAINAGRGMALEVDQVAAVAFAFSVPEVVLAATYHGSQRGARRNVPAQIAAVGRVVAVGLVDHGYGVPVHIHRTRVVTVKRESVRVLSGGGVFSSTTPRQHTS